MLYRIALVFLRLHVTKDSQHILGSLPQPVTPPAKLK